MFALNRTFCCNPGMDGITIEQLAELLLHSRAERGRVLLALDGRCASGKTTVCGIRGLLPAAESSVFQLTKIFKGA